MRECSLRDKSGGNARLRCLGLTILTNGWPDHRSMTAAAAQGSFLFHTCNRRVVRDRMSLMPLRRVFGAKGICFQGITGESPAWKTDWRSESNSNFRYRENDEMLVIKFLRTGGTTLECQGASRSAEKFIAFLSRGLSIAFLADLNLIEDLFHVLARIRRVPPHLYSPNRGCRCGQSADNKDLSTISCAFAGRRRLRRSWISMAGAYSRSRA
jgi:hypothetical protein